MEMIGTVPFDGLCACAGVEPKNGLCQSSYLLHMHEEWGWAKWEELSR